MDTVSALLLLALSGIWSGSFIFMRYLAPIFGAVMTANLRLLIAGVFLLGIFAVLGVKLEWKKNWKQYLVVGIVNSGAPFLLYSFAALHLPNGPLVISVVVVCPFWAWHFRRFANLPALLVSHLVLGVAAMILLGSGQFQSLRVGWPLMKNLLAN